MSHVNSRVHKHRAALRMAGMRPIQIWVPDTRRPGFAEECQRQTLRVVEAESDDADMQDLMDDSLGDIEGWSE